MQYQDSDLIAKVKIPIKNDKFPFQKLLCIIAPLEISMTMMGMILGRGMMMLRTTVYVIWTIPTQYHRGSSGQ